MKKHRTVERIATILEAVADNPKGFTVSTLTRNMAVPKSSVYSLVQGLLATGYLSEDEGLLAIGPSMKLLLNPSSNRLIQNIAHEHLQELSRKSGETVQLGILTGYDVVVLSQIESPQEVRYVVKLHSRRPLLTTSMGKILLANLNEYERQRYLESQREESSEAVERFLSEFSEIRESGIAYNREETTVGVCAVGAGLKNSSDKVIAAVCVAGPAFRVQPLVNSLAEDLLQTSETISKRLRQ